MFSTSSSSTAKTSGAILAHTALASHKTASTVTLMVWIVSFGRPSWPERGSNVDREMLIRFGPKNEIHRQSMGAAAEVFEWVGVNRKRWLEPGH
jgi:hypothetical protein